MTRAQIRSAARLLISETDASNSHFSDPDLNNLINEWQRDVAIRVRSPRKEVTTMGPTVLDQRLYTPPTDLLSVIKLLVEDESGDEKELPFIRFEDLGKQFGTGWFSDDSAKPAVYYIQSRTEIGLHPKPDSDNASKTVRLFYVPVPADLSTDTAAPDVEDVFHDSAKFFVAAHAHASVQNVQMYDQLLAQYNRKVQQFKDQGTVTSEEALNWSWSGVTDVRESRTHPRDLD